MNSAYLYAAPRGLVTVAGERHERVIRGHVRRRCSLTIVFAVVALSGRPQAQATDSLPSPLRVADVVRLVGDGRAEVSAARAAARAAAQRPAIASALEDPMLSPSIDHLPFMLAGADVSFTIEQRFPLSGVRSHRRQAAEAGVDRARADLARTSLDVTLEAVNAFFMLHERRQSAAVLDEQLALARQIVGAANARYAGATGPQSDVLRAEVEVARLEGLSGAARAEIRAAEAMLNVSLGREPDASIPPLAADPIAEPTPAWPVVKAALTGRPELAAGRAEIARATADVQVMRDMYKPMAMVRTGPAYTMTDGSGVMLMVGMSLPIWRGRLRAGVAEAEAMRDMAHADLDAMRRMIEGQAAVALSEVDAARARHTALRDEVLPRARHAIDPSLAAYAAGRLPLVSVLEAVQALWITQSELIDSEMTLGLARARLGRAIGTYEAVRP
jgi:cobalt-zinc-cadmium efflux system outer membrane protein